ncbi:MAG: hypothetical protein U0736_04020 [Gemmataceae bacterium]
MSWEAEPLKHGVFFHYVLDGLQSRQDVDGEVTWDARSQHVHRQVTRAIPNWSATSPGAERAGGRPGLAPGAAQGGWRVGRP